MTKATKKTGAYKMLLLVGTEGRDRTGTSVTSLVFETNASTYSATSAWYGWLRQAQPTLTSSANFDKHSQLD